LNFAVISGWECRLRQRGTGGAQQQTGDQSLKVE
jgi:hypothetical protein